MRWRTAAALAFLVASSASSQTPPTGPSQAVASPDQAREEARLETVLRALAPQRPGVVDAYVVSVALDSDPVFSREASVAADVLQRRYDAARRTVTLVGRPASAESGLPRGSPATLARTLARVAEIMDESEDVLILYSTSHGTPLGLTYRDGDEVLEMLTPKQMRSLMDQNGIRNRLFILSACFSGVFIPGLQTANSVIVTAASRDRTSFGCVADNDWTFFGDAMINRALRKPQTLGAAYAEAADLVSGWEQRFGVTPSLPRIFLGAESARWLNALERRMPASGTQPVGRPAAESSAGAFARR